MTIPARGRLVLRRVAGKRLPHHSVERKWDDAGVQTATLTAAWSFGSNRGQRIARMTTSEAANGKSRFLTCSRILVTVPHPKPSLLLTGYPLTGTPSHALCLGSPRARWAVLAGIEWLDRVRCWLEIR